MKAKVSPLLIKDFDLLSFKYDFVVPKKTIDDIDKLFKSYAIDIDFEHREMDNGTFQVLCTIGVNHGKKPKIGYSIQASAIGIFEIENENELDAKIVGNLRFFSSLNMVINNLRNVIFQNTNIGPLNGYLLPPIDVTDLFLQKKNEQEKKEVE